MISTITYSLEEVSLSPEGHAIHPVICEACYQAIHKERHARSCPKSYAALATSEYSYTVLDWKGLHTTSCRCCGSNRWSSRYSVELYRKRVR